MWRESGIKSREFVFISQPVSAPIIKPRRKLEKNTET
jgi:hypothetical protein